MPSTASTNPAQPGVSRPLRRSRDERLVAGGAGAPPSDPELDQLTPGEGDVLFLIARGYTYKEVGAKLHVSVKTVETHVSNVLRKLQLSSRNELTRWAARRCIV